jgi:hypothetical protein
MVTIRFLVVLELSIQITFGLDCDNLTITVPVFLYGAGRNDFNAGKSITRAMGRGGP